MKSTKILSIKETDNVRYAEYAEDEAKIFINEKGFQFTTVMVEEQKVIGA